MALPNEPRSAPNELEVALTAPTEQDCLSVITTVTVSVWNEELPEDALWQQRNNAPIITPDETEPRDIEVDIHPRDTFIIDGERYRFAGTNKYNSNQLLFRPLTSGGEVTDHTPSCPYRKISKDEFEKAFQSRRDTYFECRRVKPKQIEKDRSRLSRIQDLITS